MSELTPCNRCTLNAITRRAEARGATVTVRRCRLNEVMHGWFEVKESDRDDPAAYLLQLTEGCEC